MRDRQRVAEHPKRLERLARSGREVADVRRYERPAIGDVAAQQRAALGLAEPRVVVVHTERGEDLGQRAAVDLGVLADVQPRIVKTEHLDLTDHVVQVTGGCQLAVGLPQAALHAAQVGQELSGLRVGARAAGLGRADPLADEGQRPPVGLLGIQRRQPVGQLREVALSGGEDRAQPFRMTAQALGQRQAPRQPLGVSLKQAQALFSHQVQGLHSGLGGDERVAVAVPPDPRSEAQQRPDAQWPP